jgi:predicted esterase
MPEGELRSPRTLLIYLHGVIAPTGRMQAYVQGVVARAARAHGIVAIVPRGRRGIGPAKTNDWWAWPTTGAAYARYADELVAEWKSARASLEESIGAPFERVWLAGSSNGAYFATVLALKGRFEADAYGAISGGMRGRFTKDDLAERKRVPFYVGYGSQDEAKTDPIALADLLREAKWPYKAAEHRVGHGAHDVYMGEAFAFWEQSPP